MRCVVVVVAVLSAATGTVSAQEEAGPAQGQPGGQSPGQAPSGAPARNAGAGVVRLTGKAPVAFVPKDVSVDDFWVKAAGICEVGVEPAKAQLGALDGKALASWCKVGNPKVFLRGNTEVNEYLDTYAAAVGCAKWKALAADERPAGLKAAQVQLLDAACARVAKPADLKLVSDITYRYFLPEAAGTASGSGAKPAPASVSPGATSPIVTTSDIMVRAIAGFLEKRAKAEFKLFILKRLRDKLCDDGLRPWVPSTCAFIGSSSDDAALPLSLGPGFRAALVQDAVELPQRIVVRELKSGGAAALGLRIALETGRVLVQHRSAHVVGQLLENLAAGSGLERFTCVARDAQCAALLRGVRYTGAVVRILYDENLQKVDATAAAGVLANKLKVLGLTVDPARIKGQVEQILSAAKKTDESVARLEAALESTKGDSDHRVRAILRAVGELADSAIALLVAGSAIDPTVQAAFAGAVEHLSAARDLCLAMVEANLARIAALVVSRAAGVVSIPGPVVRTVSFAVDLATARTAEEAEAVIESVAAPVGAWQAKREDNWFSVTGFVGLSYGIDWMRVAGDGVVSQAAAPLGAVGLDINFSGWPHENARLGLFVSLIDVGQIFSLTTDPDPPIEDRMGETTDVEIERGAPLGFLQVFAPGLFLRLGIADSPFTVGVGATRVPEARTVRLISNGTAGEPDDVDVLRFSAWAAMDVTIFPF